ncbi:serum response factor homolog [Culicoides brevitarsis]|uniref:serum response factor homolog n=1 Tax=Culicoides brevitarsis TaxID=469753 RepID=UPI00307B3AA5
MDPNRDSRYNLNYSMMMSDGQEIYGNPNVTLARPPSGLGQVMSRGGGGGNGGQIMPNSQCAGNRGIKRGASQDCYDDRGMAPQNMGGGGGGLDCGTNNVQDVVNETNYTSLQPKSEKSPPSNGKKTKGRVKIKMEYIDNKLRRYTTFSKRKTGIMKKAYELSTLTGTQVMLLVASETGHVYTFATRKLQPMITSEAGKALIQTCLNSPDPPNGAVGDQRMSATGFEETELSYNIADEDSKDERSGDSSGAESDDSSGADSPGPASLGPSQLTQSNLHSFNGSNNFVSSSSSNMPSLSMPSLQVTTSAAAAATGSSSSATQKMDATTIKIPTLTATPTLSGNGVIYPAAALANLPQDVLVQLVQSGQLQVHTDADSGNQYITIPIPLHQASSGSPSTSSKNVKSMNGDSPMLMKDINVKTEINND